MTRIPRTKGVIDIVCASPAHVGPIASRMREADLIEVGAMGYNAKLALRRCLATSTEAWTAKVDGRCEAMFGLTITSALDGRACPWMLGSDEIYKHPRVMLRFGQQVITRWLDSSCVLSNLVSRENLRAIRMLRRWGFTIGDEATKVGEVDFLTFRKDR